MIQCLCPQPLNHSQQIGVLGAHFRHPNPVSMDSGDPGRLRTRAPRQAATQRHTCLHTHMHSALPCPHLCFWRQRSWADLAHNQVSYLISSSQHHCRPAWQAEWPQSWVAGEGAGTVSDPHSSLPHTHCPHLLASPQQHPLLLCPL